MHPVSVPANSTLPPVKAQKKKNIAGRQEEEVEGVWPWCTHFFDMFYPNCSYFFSCLHQLENASASA